MLRTRNVLEFYNSEFDLLCEQNVILRHKTVLYILQQNGVAERMNRTLLDKVGYMMLKFGLLKVLWGEAYITIAYIVNRTPSSALEGKTLAEKWSGKLLNYSYLKVFGCIAYSHQNLGKLETRVKSVCIYIFFYFVGD